MPELERKAELFTCTAWTKQRSLAEQAVGKCFFGLPSWPLYTENRYNDTWLAYHFMIELRWRIIQEGK